MQPHRFSWRQKRTAFTALALASWCWSAPAHGQTSFQFHALAQIGAPSTDDNPFQFRALDPFPSIDGLGVGFAAGTGFGTGGRPLGGVYKGSITSNNTGPTFRVRSVVDDQTGIFTSPTSIDSGRTFFPGTRDISSTYGIWPSIAFVDRNANSQAFVDDNDVLPTSDPSVMIPPDPSRRFTHWSIGGTQKLVRVEQSFGTPSGQPYVGLYNNNTTAPGVFGVIADTLMQDDTGNTLFSEITGGDVDRGGNMVFYSSGVQGSGLTHLSARSGDPFADRELLDAGSFGLVRNPVVAGTQVAFRAAPLGFSGGVYKTVRGGSGATVVADTSIPIPSGTGNFNDFGQFISIDNGDIVFTGSSDPTLTRGLYLARSNGALVKVIAPGDLLDGLPVIDVSIGPEAISHDRIVFQATRQGESTQNGGGIYLATYGNGHLDLTGATQTNPLLPVEVAPGNFMFTNAPTGQWVDPPLVPGYEYIMDSADTLFTAILEFPIGFDQPFEVVADGVVLGSFDVDEGVNFLDLLGHGVDRFTVRGISPLVDAEDPAGFPLRIAFDADTASFRMIAIPEPASGILLLAMAAGLWQCRRHNRC